MNLFKANVPPSKVPTLTEVVEVVGAQAEVVIEPVSPSEGGSVPALAVPQPVNADIFTQQIMADIQRQIDAMLEVRLKEALAPIMSRMTDALARDARSELTKVMKEVVARAVAEELRRGPSKR